VSEQPVRRGWRGEAAGIPPARVLVPAASTAPAHPAASTTAPAHSAGPDTSASTWAAPGVARFTAPGGPATAGRPKPAPSAARPRPVTADRPGPAISAADAGNAAASGSAWANPPAPAGSLASGAEPRDDFPLWPTTSTVVLHEVVPDPDAEAREAHQAGRAAVLDRFARMSEQTYEMPAGYGLDDTDREWPPRAMRAMREPRDARRSSAPRRTHRRRRTRPARGPLAGLSAMLLVALLAGFFAWTSAEPFWLDMGHGVRGTAQVTSCKDSGVLRRCLAEFAAAGREPVPGARLMGLEADPGDSVAAVMVPGGRIAYAGAPSGLRVRWAAGIGLVVLCGIALAWLTGAWRFARLRDRLTAWTLTAAAPLTLAAAIVLASY
jgi:hypothetical protein